jgi:hypothetical protein
LEKMDLVDAIEFAKQEGSKNVYWSWDQSRRDEFKSYRAALRAQEEQQHAIPEEGDEDGDEQDDDGLDDILAECSPPPPADTDASTQADDDDPAAEEPAPKKAPSKWIEYCGYAREALKEGGGKPTQKEVFAKAREWLIEDKWMKPK